MAQINQLCQFHLSQSVWRWLWDSRHSISKEDCQPLMHEFRCVVHSTKEAQANTTYYDCVNSETAADYPTYCAYIEELWERREMWCCAWRTTEFLRGQHTNNYCEVTVRLFKDHVLSRCKAYNAVSLVDFVVTVMETFYRSRLERFANSRITLHHLLLEKLLTAAQYLTKNHITTSSTDRGTIYRVPSESNPASTYEVDTAAGLCTCVAGMNGRCCKHQTAVWKYFNEALPNCPPVTASDRYAAAKLALGEDVPAPEFYEQFSLQSSSSKSLSTDVVHDRVSVERAASAANSASGCYCTHFSSHLFGCQLQHYSLHDL